MSAIQEEEFESKKIKWSTWKELLSFTVPYKKNLGLIIMFMSFSGIMDVLMPMCTSVAIDYFIMPKRTEGLIWFALVYCAMIGIAGFNCYSFIGHAGKVQNYVAHDIRKACFDRLQELSFNYYDKTAVGYLMARMTSDCSRLADTIAWSLVDIAWGLIFMLIAMVGMLIMRWQLALCIIVMLPIIAVLAVIFRKFILKHQREARKANSKITGAFNEGIMGARTTKTLVREELNFSEFQDLTGQMERAAVRSSVISAMFWPMVGGFAAVGTALVLWVGGNHVIFGDMTVGQLSFFLQLSGYFFEPVLNIARIFTDLQSTQAAAERVMGLIETEPQIVDRPDVMEKYGTCFEPRRENWPDIRGKVEFKDVSFVYDGGEKVLDHFNLTVQPGQQIALVGETGSGKSTIVNLICRFYEPTSGSITIDDVDYRERSQIWLHSNLGYVLQTPQLFSGTIRDNIRYGRLEATDEEVEQAARLVGAHDFIIQLPDGYLTQVGEGGGRLSTGEKQLISFARAIVSDPALFVLDEATSSIDTETEQRIQHAIDSVLKGRTSFIIAHRLSTIRNSDRILVIKEGKMVESGTHDELMALKQYYYQLYTNQFRSEQTQQVLGNA